MTIEQEIPIVQTLEAPPIQKRAYRKRRVLKAPTQKRARVEQETPIALEAPPIQRRERRPFSSKALNMPLPDIPEFVCRWFNDEDNKLFRAQDGGWSFVTPSEFMEFRPSLYGIAPNSDLGTRISIVCGSDEYGSPLRAYLMKISKEFYYEDMAMKREAINVTDKAIHGGRLHPHAGMYVKSVKVT